MCKKNFFWQILLNYPPLSSNEDYNIKKSSPDYTRLY